MICILHNLRNLFFIIAFLIPVCGQSQYKVIDSETKQPLAYTRIETDHSENKILSDFNGEFHLNDSLKNSGTILISCTGYVSRTVSFKEIIDEKTIELDPIEKLINEVFISTQKGKYITDKLGMTKKSRTDVFNFFTGNNGEERAVWIPNPHSVEGFLKSVNLYITDQGFPNAHFRLHIYECLMEKKPGKELTQSNIIASGTTGNQWISVDMVTERILIGNNGCFVGIEWFDSPESRSYSDTVILKGINNQDFTHVRAGNGIVIGSNREAYRYAKNKSWYKANGGEWKCWSRTDESFFYIKDTLENGYIRMLTEDNLFYQVPCINVDVSFKKEKVKSVYQEPKKRQFNKIEKVKEDNFNYPQSNVTELVGSLIKAFENDDIIYVFRFLCTYKENEWEQIIQELEDNQEQYNALISPKEKENVLKHLNELTNALNEQSLTKMDGCNYELKINNYTYYLTVENGKWKINPYTRQIFR